MKKLLVLLAIFFVAAFTSESFAQATPEFSLHMSLVNGNKTREITFGYDSSASDGLDKKFNETDYPSSPGDDWVLLNTDSSYHGDGGVGHLKIDIRHKPADASFRMVFRWNLDMGYPCKITWDPSMIPAAIKAIIVSPTANPKQVLVDLTKQSSFTIDANNELFFSDDTVAIYYNEVPAAVAQSARMDQALISSLAASPNPAVSASTLSLRLSRSAEVAIHAYDVAGRLLMVKTFRGEAGMNEEPIVIPNYHGPVYVRVDAAADFQRMSKILTLIAE